MVGSSFRWTLDERLGAAGGCVLLRRVGTAAEQRLGRAAPESVLLGLIVWSGWGGRRLGSTVSRSEFD